MSTVCKAPRGAGSLLCGLLLVWPPLTADAGSSAGFQVAVRVLSVSQGICSSESLSQQTPLVTLVTCTSDNFVSLSAQGFVGAHASAYRFHLVQGRRSALLNPPTSQAPLDASRPEVVAMRVSSSKEPLDEQVEILVSF